MSNVSQWDPIDNNNQATAPNGYPENTMFIPQLNDTGREVMAAVARLYKQLNGSLLTAGVNNAYTLTTPDGHAAFANLPVIVCRADRANTGAATMNVDGTGDKPMVIKGGQALEQGAIQADQMLLLVPNIGQDRFDIALVSAGVTAADLASSALGASLINGTLEASVASNALTVSVKTLAGADPSAADPVFAVFRSPTHASGAFVVRRIQAAISVLVPNGATLGTSNAVPFRCWLTLHDDAGTVRLGISNRRTSSGIVPLNEAVVASTTLISAAADSAGVIYTGTAVSSKAMAVVGYLEYASGLATAGTYNEAPSLVHLHTRGGKLPGDVVQIQQAVKTDVQTGSSLTFVALSSLSPTISALMGNAVVVDFHATVGIGDPTNKSVLAKLRRDGADIAGALGDAAGSRVPAGVAATPSGGGMTASVSLRYVDFPGPGGSYTYSAAIGAPAAWTVGSTNNQTDHDQTPLTITTLTLTEIMG